MVISDCGHARLDQSVGQGIAVLGQKCSCGMKKLRTCLALSLILNLVSWLGPYIFYNANTTRLSQSERHEGINLQAYLEGNFNNQNKCNHLSEIRTEDGWFEDNFQPSLKPMWTPRRENISQEVFTWWNSLSSSNNTYKLVYGLAKELTAIAPEDISAPQESTFSCTRCAVVGNSGNLKHSGYGRLIDVHDIIVRMNRCPTKGYEKDVGSRTTHYVAYPSSYRESDLANASLVFAAFNLEDLKWLREKVTSNQTKSNNGHQHIDKERVLLLNPELMWHIKHQWGLGKGRWASTGLLSIFVALQMCDQVDVFGFGANHLGYWDHYFENNNGEKNSAFIHTLVHDKDAETNLLNRLIKSKAVTMFQGFR